MIPDDDDLVAHKAALRRQLKLIRADIPADERARRTAAVIEFLVELAEPLQATVISGFWPLPGELDLRSAFPRLAAKGHTIALPRMQGATRPLTFHVYREGDPLIRAGFGVEEPSAEAPVVRPRVALVPLLGFDRRGHRLGYGKGYYDRTLAALHADDPELLAIGVTFATQEVPLIPIHARDHPLDAIITDQGVIRTPLTGAAADHLPHRP